VCGIKLEPHRDWFTWFFVSILSLVLVGCTGTSVPIEELALSESASTSGVNEQGNGSEGNGSEGDGSEGDGSDGDGGTASNAPAVSLSASNLSIQEGGSVTLSWTAAGADSCSASGGWSGQFGSSGNQTVGPVVAGTTFSLNCSGPGGTSLEMISVAVVGPVELSWVAPEQNVDGSDLVDLAGYRVYYGDNSRDYSDSVEVADTTATSHSLDLPTGDYYFAMTAFDSEGHESNYSNEVQRYRP